MTKANSKGKTTTPIRDLGDRELHDLQSKRFQD